MTPEEKPHIPPIEICNGCNEADILGLVNATNQERNKSVISVCGMLAFAATQEIPEDVTDKLTQTLNRARQIMGTEKSVVDRVNSLHCESGEVCARRMSYDVDGGVYLARSYRKPPPSDLDDAQPPESA